MGKTYLKINAERTAYEPMQIVHTMTVGELIRFLENYNDNMPVVLSYDNGYMFGKITENSFSVKSSK